MCPSLARESSRSGGAVSHIPHGKDREPTIHEVSMHPKKLDQLPPETLQNIVNYVGWNDLFNIQTISRQFHRLASTQIYRTLDFNVTCYDGDDKGDIASRAADALQTINTSSYDYAQHIRGFRLGLAEDQRYSAPGLNYSTPGLIASVVFDSKSDSSKFLNTSILLMVRRTSILESFKWDLPLEISGAVYRALQNIPSLRYLRIRMDIHPTPKFIPSRSPYNPSHPPPPSNFSQPPPTHNPSTMIVPSISQSYSPAYKGPILKRKKSGGSTFWSDRRAFSGLKTLNTLEIVRLASLDCLAEISQCLKASAASLKSLVVTLDPNLVMRTRKSTSANLPHDFDDPSDTELEDELLMDTVSPVAQVGHPANEADLREEKSAQEGILAKLFDLESSAPKGKKLEKKLGLVGGKCLKEERHAALDSKMDRLLKSITEENALSSSKTDPARLEKMKILREMADLYISEHGARPGKASNPTKHKPPPAKEVYKPPEPKGPKYPSPMAGSSKHDSKWEEFEGDYGAMIESPDFGMTYLSGKPNGFQQYPSNNSSSSLHLPPPVPYTGGTTSSFDLPPMSYSGGTSSSFEMASPLPYYSGTKKPGTNGQNLYIESHCPLFSAPFDSNSYKKSLSNNHPKSLCSSGTHSPSTTDKYEAFLGGYAKKEPSDNPGTSKKSKKANNLNSKMKTARPATAMSSPSSDSDSDSLSKAELPPKVPFFATEAITDMCDGIDVDMDHPDERQSDLGEDQQSISGSDDTEVQTPRKRFKPLEESRDSSARVNGGASSLASFKEEKPLKRTNSEEMHDYIRATHGFQLEEFRLHYVPMKASIIGKALDLTVLQRITLLETGPQDAFWTLLVKLTGSDTPIGFKSIHTDNVSSAFLVYLATYEGLEELFMHERKSKNGDIDSEGGVDIESIREEAFRPHLKTLKRLMLRNEKNDSWDVDFKTLHMLAVYGHILQELAINVRLPTHHVLLQIFPAFKTLRALHLITLRGPDRSNLSAQLESLAYTVDSLAHCPDLNIRYIAIQDIVTEISGHKQFRKHLMRIMEGRQPDKKAKVVDKKGKGKAEDGLLGDATIEEDSEMSERIANVQSAQKKMRCARRFDEVRHIKIFSIELRSGKL